jgi:hypothetical protein
MENGPFRDDTNHVLPIKHGYFQLVTVCHYQMATLQPLQAVRNAVLKARAPKKNSGTKTSKQNIMRYHEIKHDRTVL